MSLMSNLIAGVVPPAGCEKPIDGLLIKRQKHKVYSDLRTCNRGLLF